VLKSHYARAYKCIIFRTVIFHLQSPMQRITTFKNLRVELSFLAVSLDLLYLSGEITALGIDYNLLKSRLIQLAKGGNHCAEFGLITSDAFNTYPFRILHYPMVRSRDHCSLHMIVKWAQLPTA